MDLSLSLPSTAAESPWPLDRHALIALMAYPRRKMREHIDGRQCAHALFYNPSAFDCITCEQDMECQWINRNDELTALEHKSDEALLKALTQALHFVEAQLTAAHLNRRACRCDNCLWLQQARALLQLS
ncbi:MAG: hypothetical protein R3Y10_03215 [Ferrimonas sp.]